MLRTSKSVTTSRSDVSSPSRSLTRAKNERKGTKKPDFADSSDDDEFDTGELDTSLLAKIAACPDEGTVLKKVDDWISDLEGKYAGRSRNVVSDDAVCTRSVYETDPVVVKDNVRKHVSGIPFPSWDGMDEAVIKDESKMRRCATPPVQHHDYAPDLLRVDDIPEDEDEDDRDAGVRLVRAYSNSCMKQAKSAVPQVIEALSRRKAEKLLVSNCSMADGGIIAVGPYLGQLVGLTSLDLSTNMIFDDGATALAKALKSCAKLTSLVLDNNKIGTYGATALAEQFKSKNSSVTCLSVRKNQLRYANFK